MSAIVGLQKIGREEVRPSGGSANSNWSNRTISWSRTNSLSASPGQRAPPLVRRFCFLGGSYAAALLAMKET